MKTVHFGSNPYLFPMPVLIIGTYDESGVPNAMNAAWGMISDFDEISISLGEHKTTDNLKKAPAFTVSIGTEDTMLACDYLGIVSGAEEPDKVAKSGLHVRKSETVDAPLFRELPMALECTVRSFESGILIGKIVDIIADERILTDGSIDPAKLKPIAFDPVNETYMTLGKTIGKAYQDGLKLK